MKVKGCQSGSMIEARQADTFKSGAEAIIGCRGHLMPVLPYYEQRDLRIS